jgi:hypothetical protein
MFKVKLATAIIIIGGILIAAISFAAPLPDLGPRLSDLVDTANFHSTLAFLCVSSTYSVGGGLLLLLGLNGFSAAFRRTYYYIAAGLVIQSLGSFYYVYGLYAGTAKTDTYALIAEIPIVIGIIIVYIGYMRYTRLLRIDYWLTNPMVVIIGSAVIMAGVMMIPYRNDIGVMNGLVFRSSHSLQAVEFTFYVLAAATAWRIRNNAGKLYAKSMFWAMWAMVTAFAATFVFFIQDYAKLPTWLSGDGMTLLFLITNLLTIVSAYAFNKIAHAPIIHESQQNTLLDSIMFLSSLASKPSEIDPILDDVRIITAGRDIGSPLTASETQQLQSVYNRLEEYLLTKEQLRDLNREQLDQLMQERFNTPAAE